MACEAAAAAVAAQKAEVERLTLEAAEAARRAEEERLARLAEEAAQKAEEVYHEARSKSQIDWVGAASEDADSGLCALIHRLANEVSEEVFVLFLTQGAWPDIHFTETEVFILEDTSTYAELYRKMHDPKSIIDF